MVRISNQRLLRLLENNSRTPFLKIAKAFGVSETAVRKRVKKLQSEGVIQKFTIEVNPHKIGFNTVALIGLDVAAEQYLLALDKLKVMKQPRRVLVSSGDHMILLECWFKSSAELTEFTKRLREVPGVSRVCPAIILERIK